MLFFGDIHITSRHAPDILRLISESADHFPQETTLIFLGDYVYHFVYDRQALLQLLSLFIDLAKKGKKLFILAGNHDWISGHFVFEEARQILAYLGQQDAITFITTPQIQTIEGVDCLLAPFTHILPDSFSSDRFPALADDPHPQIRHSRQINNTIAEHISSRKQQSKRSEKLLVIHHRYIAAKKFPGQQAVFGYTSPALSPDFLEDEALWFVSGHLHEAFVDMRYLCTGSLRHTSPLEYNQQKYIFRLDVSTWTYTAREIAYNPYLLTNIEHPPFSVDALETLLHEIADESKKQLVSGFFSLIYESGEKPKKQHITLTITMDAGSSKDLDDLIDIELTKQLKTVRHKLISTPDHVLLEDLDRASLDLTTRFSDWKLLLARFLEQKYQTQAEPYKELLREADIL